MLTGWSLDELGYCTTCSKCNSSFDIHEDMAKSIYIPSGTRVKLLYNGSTGIIDGNDFENTDDFSNINYYFVNDEVINSGKDHYSDDYEMILRDEFELI